MLVLPQLAYIGHALLTYTLHNPTQPNTTPLGPSFYDTFHANCTLSLLAGPPTTPPSPAAIAAFEAALPAAPHIIDVISGGDYFTLRQPPAPDAPYLALDTRVVGRARGQGHLVRFTAGGFIKINELVRAILGREEGARSTEYGETEFWEPIEIDTAEEGLGWLNSAIVVSQGRLLVEEGRGVGFELRLFTLVNGRAGEAGKVEEVEEKGDQLDGGEM